MSGGLPYRRDGDGILLFLRVTPNAGLDRIEGFESRDDGTTVLRVRVRAVPDKGKANAAVIALLGKTLGVPRSSISLVAGETSRHKTLRVDGDADRLAEQLAAIT
jgi:uncharacterized protein (TIGR00251 family)